jgi:hypothetical protein
MRWVRVGQDRWIPLWGMAFALVAFLWLGSRASYWSASLAAEASSTVIALLGLSMVLSLVRPARPVR